MDQESIILKGLEERDTHIAGCMKSSRIGCELQKGLISQWNPEKAITLVDTAREGVCGLSLEGSGPGGGTGCGMKVEVGV